jgi:Protein of unknown function (DUF3015)
VYQRRCALIPDERLKPALWQICACDLAWFLVRSRSSGIASLFARDVAAFRYTREFFGTQTFGITSGTSECTTDGVIRSERAVEAFAEATFESLTQEMAQGEGEHLRAFASLLGCSAESFNDFGRLTQRQYTHIVPHDVMTPVELSDAVQRSIAGDPVLSRTGQG